MSYFEGVNSSNIKPSISAQYTKSGSVKKSEEKENKACNPNDMLNAINAQGFVNKPFVTTTNELTFSKDGAIVADRRKMTIQNGKVQFGKPVSMALPLDATLSSEENKEKYINKLLSNSENILNCVFLAEDFDGQDVQVSISADKEYPYKFTVSKRNDMKGEFQEDEVIILNKSIGSSDDAISTVIQIELEKYGIENLKQIAVANKD